jgi:hypothetical protein
MVAVLHGRLPADSTDADRKAREDALLVQPTTSTTVRVDLSRRGKWEIALPDSRDPVACETLDEAKQVAFRCAVHRHPCELIVCDAYHRVSYRGLVGGAAEPVSAAS